MGEDSHSALGGVPSSEAREGVIGGTMMYMAAQDLTRWTFSRWILVLQMLI